MSHGRRGRRTLKLKPELVPHPLWGISAFRLLRGGASWKAIRTATLEAAGNRCSVCEASVPPLFCHEVWRYDDRKGVATLAGLRIVCQDCNRVTHMGLAHVRGELAEALAQLCRVNRITEGEAKQMFERASATWERRSRKRWRVAVAPSLLKQYPQLEVLVGLDTRRVGPLHTLRVRVTRGGIVEVQ